MTLRASADREPKVIVIGRVDATERDRLKAVADANERTVSAELRLAIRAWLEQAEAAA